MNIFDINNIAFTAWGYGICWLELLGFITGFISIYLAGRSNVLTFWIGLLNCTIFFALFLQQHLYSMMLLQVVFAIINIYGIVRWTRPKRTQQAELRISTLSPQALLGVLLFIIFGSIAWYSLIGDMAQRFPDIISEPQYPFVDALLLVSNVVGQWLLARKKIENWYIWVFTDATSCVLWLVMGLYLTTILYILYLVITYNALRDRHPILHDFLKRQLPGFKVHLLGPRIECHGALRAESRGWVVPAHRMPAMARQARHRGAASLLNLSEIPETRQLLRCLHA